MLVRSCVGQKLCYQKLCCQKLCWSEVVLVRSCVGQKLYWSEVVLVRSYVGLLKIRSSDGRSSVG